MALFFDDLYSGEVWYNRGDMWVWVPVPTKAFQVKIYYGVLLVGRGCPRRFPWKGIWKICIPLEYIFFTWTVALGNILTTDNLRKWEILFLSRY